MPTKQFGDHCRGQGRLAGVASAIMPAFDDDVWELYDGNTDWTQSKDLSKEGANKLHEVQRLG